MEGVRRQGCDLDLYVGGTWQSDGLSFQCDENSFIRTLITHLNEAVGGRDKIDAGKYIEILFRCSEKPRVIYVLGYLINI